MTTGALRHKKCPFFIKCSVCDRTTDGNSCQGIYNKIHFITIKINLYITYTSSKIHQQSSVVYLTLILGQIVLFAQFQSHITSSFDLYKFTIYKFLPTKYLHLFFFARQLNWQVGGIICEVNSHYAVPISGDTCHQ